MKQKPHSFVGIFAVLSVISGSVFAAASHHDAKGNGNAKTTLETGITLKEETSINLGTIIRMGSNATGIVYELGPYNELSVLKGNLKKYEPYTGTPPFIFEGSVNGGMIKIITGKNTAVSLQKHFDENAILSDGKGNSINFKVIDWGPSYNPQDKGYMRWYFGGMLELKGNEPDGVYSTKNDGGKPFNVIIDY